MEWWNKLLSPVRRAWLALSSRLKPRRRRDGLLKLHHDIQTCEYKDVQVMWEMLQKSELEQIVNNSDGKHQAAPFLESLRLVEPQLTGNIICRSCLKGMKLHI